VPNACREPPVGTTRTRPSRGTIDDATARNASSIGTIRWEWNAWDTTRRVVRAPRAASVAATCSTAASSPLTTHAPGALTAASSAPGTIAASTSPSGAPTATMAPPDGSAPISRPRAAISRAASSSDHTPAT
jgi:hypothetical protein